MRAGRADGWVPMRPAIASELGAPVGREGRTRLITTVSSVDGLCTGCGFGSGAGSGVGSGSGSFFDSNSLMRRARACTAAGSYSKTRPLSSSNWARSAWICSCSSRSVFTSTDGAVLASSSSWWRRSCSWMRCSAAAASEVAASRSRRTLELIRIPAAPAHSAKISAIFSALAELVNSMTTVPMTATTKGTMTHRLARSGDAFWALMPNTLANALALVGRRHLAVFLQPNSGRAQRDSAEGAGDQRRDVARRRLEHAEFGHHKAQRAAVEAA